MPEGHTLHRLARDLTDAFAGARPQVSSPQGRFADGAALVDGTELVQAEAYGKQLFVEFAADRWLHVHLGLIGKFLVTRASPDQVPVTGQVRLRIATTAATADLRGPTVCEVVGPSRVSDLMDGLGPDPLRIGVDGAGAAAVESLHRVHRSNRSVAELLMDQTVLAGIGNVYRSEVLFRHRINPFTPGKRVKPASWQAIWADLVELMPLGVVAGQILTVDAQIAEVRAELATGSLGPHPREHYVYRRTGEPCLECGSRIRSQVVAGRNLFWCGRCQRRS